MPEARLCLLQVHAHPDDEASKGAGTTARYAGEGVRTVLVTCTGGEEGDILNPAADDPDTRANLAAVRLEELRESVRALNYSALHLLGYRDSGMPGTEANARPDCFANAPLDEAVGRLVAIIRQERPQVIVTYDEDHSGYPHPDHIRTHDISLAAFEAAGDPDRFPEAGPPWQPLKLYYTGWSRARLEALHNAFLARGEESPYVKWLENRAEEIDRPMTTRIDVGDHLLERRAALLAHRTQIDPDSFWMRLPEDVVREVFPWEEYRLARSLVGAPPPGEYEDDLFSGVRDEAPAARPPA
ncbi:MAG TPA: mycothiol conjugate amidase Mca [Acidimicrobiia bacterium]|nr:mycothiol conjugate amidase Mca [Acidimicrobiia bacterium]